MQSLTTVSSVTLCTLSPQKLLILLLISTSCVAMLTHSRLLSQAGQHARQTLKSRLASVATKRATIHSARSWSGMLPVPARSLQLGPLRMISSLSDSEFELDDPFISPSDAPNALTKSLEHRDYASEDINLDHLLNTTTTSSQIHPYWIEQLRLLERPAAKSLIPKLLPSNPLGYEQASGVAKKGTLMENMIQWKRQHADKIILTRVGEFYETTGVDAVMCVNYAGLNPMGNGVRAGCPIKNIQATLDSLTQAGLSVAVYEEIAEVDSGRGSASKAKLKSRVLSQIVSPASSTYIYHNMCLRSDDIEFRENRPAAGVMHTVNGYTLCQIHLDTGVMIVSERLTEEGVRSLLASTGHIEPIYTQDCSTTDLQFLTHISPGAHTYEKMSGYSEADFPAQVLRRLSRKMEISVDNIRVCNRNQLGSASSTNIHADPHTNTNTNTLMPIYTSTALQIGLISNQNVPDLIPTLLPARASAYSSRFLRKWLLNPPPVHIADCMRSLCGELMGHIGGGGGGDLSSSDGNGDSSSAGDASTATATHTTPAPLLVPRFTPMSIAKVVTLINANQCNVALFKEIRSNVNALQLMLRNAHTYRDSLHSGRGTSSSTSGDSNDCSALVAPLLALTSYECGITADYSHLLQETATVLEKIDYVIPSTTTISTSTSSPTTDVPHKDPFNRIPDAFFEENEREFRGKLLHTHPEVALIYADVRAAADALCSVVNSDFAQGYVVNYDINNNAVVLRNERAVKRDKTALEPFPTHYNTFIDRKGQSVKKSYTTENVTAALRHYITTTAAAEARVALILQQLSRALQGRHLISVVQAAHWAVVLETASAHAVSARQKGWCMPSMVDFASAKNSGTSGLSNDNSEKQATTSPISPTSAASTTASTAASMNLHGLSPYWMDRVTCTHNDVALTGLFLLTAPNMSGKSTFMRSAIVAALLANCGLCVPCTKAEVPRYDHYFLRTASYDVPSEAKSAFALEMDDVRVMLRDCTDRSLVMIDELGKGTSAKDGSALSGALLEHLDRRNITGVFATHLHELFMLPLQLRTVRDKKMGFEQDADGNVRWNYQLEDGRCTDSMALVTARQYGIDANIVQRAAQLAGRFDVLCRPESRVDCNGSAGGDWSSEVSAVCSSTECEESTTPALSIATPLTPLSTDHLPSGRRYNLNTDVLPVMREVCSDATCGVVAIPVIPAAWEPPIAYEGSACVYVLQLYSLANENLPDLLYVGETESIRQRLKQHRDHYKTQGYSFNAAVLSVRDKSAARQAETVLINALKGRGLDIENDADSKHVLFSK